MQDEVIDIISKSKFKTKILKDLAKENCLLKKKQSSKKKTKKVSKKIKDNNISPMEENNMTTRDLFNKCRKSDNGRINDMREKI